jgi:3-hydroxyacyl-[acyl-carrier-protein] dehydratase
VNPPPGGGMSFGFRKTTPNRAGSEGQCPKYRLWRSGNAIFDARGMFSDRYHEPISLPLTPWRLAVATDFVLDLDALDLSKVVFGPEELNDSLPQTGHMRHCDGVLWHNPDFTAGVGHKIVRHDEFWVPGHIPGRPLLPGVLMIEAVAQMASFLNTKSGRVKGFLGFTRCDEVSFRGQVVPGDTLYLLANLLEFNRRRFISHCQGVVNGKLVFDGKITGMTL